MGRIEGTAIGSHCTEAIACVTEPVGVDGLPLHSCQERGNLESSIRKDTELNLNAHDSYIFGRMRPRAGAHTVLAVLSCT